MNAITFHGKSQSLPAWSRELGIPESTLRSRLLKLGLSVEEAFTRPADPRFRPTPKPSGPPPIRPVPPLEERPDGRAFCRWMEGSARRYRYFGQSGTVEANAAYARFAAEWFANQGRPAPPTGEVVGVAGLVLRFLDWAEATYRKNGKMTSEVYGFRAALKVLGRLYGGTPANEFTPQRLRTVMDRMVHSGLSLKTINDYRNKVVRCFSWGVSRGLVSVSVADALPHVESLIPGRTTAPVYEPITATADVDVEAILPHLHPDPVRNAVLGDMVRVARLTGMRPGEVCELRAADLDGSRTPWLYLPASGGKTLHLDKNRRVWIGPQARAILEPRVATGDPNQPLFRLPRRRGEGHVLVPTRFLRDRIEAACQAAGVAVFKTNQLRHGKAVEVQRRYESDEAVAAALGNTPEVARQVYVDHPADAVAKRIAEELG